MTNSAKFSAVVLASLLVTVPGQHNSTLLCNDQQCRRRGVMRNPIVIKKVVLETIHNNVAMGKYSTKIGISEHFVTKAKIANH